MRNELKSNNRGVILITVVIFVMIISILAASVLYIMTNDARLAEYNIRRIQSNYAAQTGIQYYLEQLKIGPAPPNPLLGYNVDVGGGVIVPVDIYMYNPPSTDPTCPTCECPQGDQAPACIKAIANY